MALLLLPATNANSCHLISSHLVSSTHLSCMLPSYFTHWSPTPVLLGAFRFRSSFPGFIALPSSPI